MRFFAFAHSHSPAAASPPVRPPECGHLSATGTCVASATMHRASGEQIAFIVYDQCLSRRTQFTHGHRKRFRARHHMRQRRCAIGKSFNIENSAPGICPARYSPAISRCSCSGGAIRARQESVFPIINMLGKPVGGRRAAVACGHLHCYLIGDQILSDVSPKRTSRRGCFAGETTFLRVKFSHHHSNTDPINNNVPSRIISHQLPLTGR